MSKPSKRPGRAARDIHEAIRRQAAALRAAPVAGASDAELFPAVAELIEACRVAVGDAVPRSIVFEGRAYWLRVRLAFALEVFDSPTAPEPMLRGASYAADLHGHRPGH